MSNLNNNTTQLELLLQKVNDLPEAGSGGIDTSDATAVASEIFAGETAYVADGKVTGTFTIENELTEQNDLISQITTLVATKATPSVTNTEDVTEETNAYTTKLASLETAVTALETELQGKASGGSGGGVEYEIVTITDPQAKSIPFTLSRVTSTFGMYSSTTQTNMGMMIIGAHFNTDRLVLAYGGTVQGNLVSDTLQFENQALSTSFSFATPYTAVFINDPNADAIYTK